METKEMEEVDASCVRSVGGGDKGWGDGGGVRGLEWWCESGRRPSSNVERVEHREN